MGKDRGIPTQLGKTCSRKEESQQETNCTTECKQSYASEEAGIIFLSKCETEVHAQYLLQKKKEKKGEKGSSGIKGSWPDQDVIHLTINNTYMRQELVIR